MAGLTATDQISTSSASLSASTSEAFVARRRPDPGSSCNRLASSDAAPLSLRILWRRVMSCALASMGSFWLRIHSFSLLESGYSSSALAPWKLRVTRCSSISSPQSPSVVSATPTMLPVYAMEKWGSAGSAKTGRPSGWVSISGNSLVPYSIKSSSARSALEAKNRVLRCSGSLSASLWQAEEILADTRCPSVNVPRAKCVAIFRSLIMVVVG